MGKLKFEGEYYNNWLLKGKLYIKGKLQYEGEFLFHKKWNGKGYDEFGNIIYELHNGNGYVIEYDDDGILDYEGEYLYNKKWNGKGYDEYGNIIYELNNGIEGEYLNGEKI
jgi:hypothetical protein